MLLIQQLNEASSLSIEDVKKILLKDKYGKLALKKGLSLDEIDNKEAFLSTIKYYLLNNPSVHKFVSSRSGVKDLSASFFSEIRQIKSSELDQDKLNNILHNVAHIFKEHKAATTSSLSPTAKKELRDWVNGNTGYHSLSKSSQQELLSLPNARPSKAVKLYRGIMFSRWAMQSSTKYDGTLVKGEGLKFLETIRKNGKEIDLTWDRASSWTTSRDVAERFARYSAASSSTAATMNWLSRGNKFIDGDLGFVISTLAKPEDILVDLQTVGHSIAGQHGDEGEVILAPGTYHSRIVNKYTVEGEVDIQSGNKDITNDLQRLKDHADLLAKKFDLSDYEFRKNFTIHSIFRDQLNTKILMTSEVTDFCHHAYDAYRDFYINELKPFLLENSKVSLNAEATEKIHRFKKIQSHFATKSKTGEQVEMLPYSAYRSTLIPIYGMNYLEKDLLINRRISRDAVDAFERLAQGAGVQVSRNFHILGAVKQKDTIESTINKFIDKFNLDSSDTYEHNVKTVLNIFRRVTRNYATMSTLSYFQELL